MTRKVAAFLARGAFLLSHASLGQPEPLLCVRQLFPLLRSPDKNNHLSTNSSQMAEPKLIVFDLDYTLWPFWVDTHVDPPFKQGSNGKVYDCHGQHVKFYPDVPVILSKLHSAGFEIGIASRTGAVQEANDLTRLFCWDQFFHYRQIYPGCKITHFKKLHALSGIAYEDMLFFDDEHRNIHDVSTLGVTCMFVPDGVSHDSFNKGMELFKNRREAGKGRS